MSRGMNPWEAARIRFHAEARGLVVQDHRVRWGELYGSLD